MAITGSKSISLKAPSASNPHYTLTAEFSENSYSVTNNTSEIWVNAILASDSTSSFGGSNNGTLGIYWYDNNNYSSGVLVNSLTIGSMNQSSSKNISFTFNAPHKADGTLSGYAKAVWTKSSSGGYVPASGNVSVDNTTLTTIPRKSGISVVRGGKDIADTYVLIDIDRKASSYRDTIAWTCGNLSETIQTKGSNTKIALFFNTDAYNNTSVSGYVKQRSSYSDTDIMSLIPEDTEINMLFTNTTYSSNTDLGSNSVYYKYLVHKCTYTNSVSYAVTDNTSISLTGGTTKVIKGISDVAITNTPTKIINDNSFVLMYGYIPDVEYGYYGLINPFTFEKIKSTSVMVTLYDSRGYYSPATTTNIVFGNDFIDYIFPEITSLTASRTEQTSSTINFSITGKFWNGDFGVVTNTLSVYYRYKIDNGSYTSYTQLTPTISGNTFTASGTISVVSTSNATLEIKISDSAGKENIETTTITKGKSLFDIGEHIFKLNNNMAVDGSFAIGDSNSNESLILNGTNVKDYFIRKPAVLFNYPNGSADDSNTLSDYPYNYEYVEILYTSDDGIENSVKVYTKNIKTDINVCLNSCTINSTYIWIKYGVFTLKNDKILRNGEKLIRISGSAVDYSNNTNDQIRIKRILGYY